MLSVITGMLGGAGIKTYLYGVAGIAILLAVWGAYSYHENRSAQIAQLYQQTIDLNVVIAGKEHELQDKKNDIAILQTEKLTYKENVDKGVEMAVELQQEMQRVKKEHEDEITIWKKRTDRLAAPFQKKPHLVIKLINRSSKRVFDNLTKITSSDSY